MRNRAAPPRGRPRAMVGLVLAAAAVAGEASPWVQGHHSRARLVAGGADGAARLAGDRDRPRSGFQDLLALPRANPACRRRSTGRGRRTSRRPRCSGRRRTRFEDAGGVAYGYKRPASSARCGSSPKRSGKAACRLALSSITASARTSASRPRRDWRWPFGPARRLGPRLHRGGARPRAAAAGARRAGRSVRPRGRAETRDGKPAFAVAVRAPAGAPDPFRRRRPRTGILVRRAAAAAPGRRASGAVRPVHSSSFERPKDAGRNPRPAACTLAAGEACRRDAQRASTPTAARHARTQTHPRYPVGDEP